MKAYKLFRVVNNELHPLYIKTETVIPIGVHMDAEEGEQTPDGKVKAKGLHKLAYRPGWHLTEIPFADHIGKRQPDRKLFQAADTVWCEVELDDAVDYTDEAKAKSKIKRYQCLRKIPVNGYYWYTTNAAAKVRWLISGGITVIKKLTHEEVAAICRAHGMEPQPVVQE